MVSKPLVFLILLCVVMDVVGCYVCCCENQGVWTEWEKQLRRRRFSSAAGSLFGRLATTKPMPAGNGHQTQWPLIIIEGSNDIHHIIHNVYIGIQCISWFNHDINMKYNMKCSALENKTNACREWASDRGDLITVDNCLRVDLVIKLPPKPFPSAFWLGTGKPPKKIGFKSCWAAF